jgi:uncharacterized protein (DUF1778 family)
MRTTTARASSVLIRLHPEEKELLRLNASIQGLSVSLSFSRAIFTAAL